MQIFQLRKQRQLPVTGVDLFDNLLLLDAVNDHGNDHLDEVLCRSPHFR